MYKKILITGGAGFVGSNLAFFFKQDNPKTEVVALDNLKRRGSELNISRLKEAGIVFLHGDIRSKEDIEFAGDFDLLIDCSAEPSVLAGFGESPEYLINTNLVGTLHCLEAARKNKSDVIFLSTSRVYPYGLIEKVKFDEKETRFEVSPKQEIRGISSKGISEEFPMNGVRSMYGATKLASELILQEYISMYNMRGIINRCGLLTGSWQMGKVDQGVIVLWLARHIYGGNLKYIGYGGSGKQVRDMLHVADLYELLKIQIKDFDKHSGEVYNVGGGNNVSVSLLELTKLCEEATGKKIKIEGDPENRQADIPYYITDNSKITDATGWKPKTGAKEIIKEIASWIEENKEMLRPILS